MGTGMLYLLDTCVVSEFVNKRTDPKVIAFVNELDQTETFLSVVTVGEVAKGIAKLPPSRKKEQLQEWFDQSLLPRFGDNLVSIDTAVMLRWGMQVAAMELKGRVVATMDSLIAAQCLTRDLILVTRNVRDFDGTGVRIVNPWE
jgi:toxin FitB